MREDALLQQAVSAARAGRELTARDIFLEIVEINPRNETAWMWLTGLLDDLDDCIFACEQVLEINPSNAKIHQYLNQLRGERKKQQEARRLHVEEQVSQARELIKARKRGDALALVHSLARDGETNAGVWQILADLAPEMDERLHALEKLIALTPGDAHARKELERLQHFQKNPQDLAAMYEEQGNIEKAIETYGIASLRATSKSQQNSIYWKTIRLENLRQEKIAHSSPAISIARLTGGPPLLYFMLLLVHVGLNPVADPEPLLWFGFFWVLLGGFMIAHASVRSHSRLWSLLFKEIGSSGTPAARFFMAAAGWILVILPFVLLFYMAFVRMNNFEI